MSNYPQTLRPRPAHICKSIFPRFSDKQDKYDKYLYKKYKLMAMLSQ